MLRWLVRLVLVALVLIVVGKVVSGLLNRDEDFDDFDDIDAGFEFTETPVEIDVSAVETDAVSERASASTDSIMVEAPTGRDTITDGTPWLAANGESSIIDINGIGPTYASRLQDIGIATLADLANADVDALTEQVDVIGGRSTIEDWVEQARSMTSSNA